MKTPEDPPPKRNGWQPGRSQPPCQSKNSALFKNTRRVTSNGNFDQWLLGYLLWLEGEYFLLRGGKIASFYLSKGWAEFSELRASGRMEARYKCWLCIHLVCQWLAQLERRATQ